METDDSDPLRKLLAEAIEKINIEHAELTGQSPRAAAILAVAFLDNEIEDLVRSKFPRNLSNTIWDTIAGPGFTPLGSYKARNDVAYAFGFYGPHTHSALEYISTIRNKFAHEPDVRNFDHTLVWTPFKKLVENIAAKQIAPTACSLSPNPDEVRGNFLDIVGRFMERLARVRTYYPELGDQPPAPLL